MTTAQIESGTADVFRLPYPYQNNFNEADFLEQSFPEGHIQDDGTFRIRTILCAQIPWRTPQSAPPVSGSKQTFWGGHEWNSLGGRQGIRRCRPSALSENPFRYGVDLRTPQPASVLRRAHGRRNLGDRRFRKLRHRRDAATTPFGMTQPSQIRVPSIGLAAVRTPHIGASSATRTRLLDRSSRNARLLHAQRVLWSAQGRRNDPCRQVASTSPAIEQV